MNINQILTISISRSIIGCIAILIGGCGVASKDPFKLSQPTSPCVISKSGSVSTITCPNGSVSTINDGSTGSNGHSSIVLSSPASPSQCSNGGYVIVTAIDINDNNIIDYTIDSNIQSSIVCNGMNGANATPVTTVEFCQQGVTHYPNHFPEYGLCIAGSIYAVYWDQANENAWLAEIVPGRYKSTATGLQCTFTVNSNCGISN